MVQKKHKNSIDLVSVRNSMEQLKVLVLSMGLPYTNVRRIDDALEVINIIENRKNNGKQKA